MKIAITGSAGFVGRHLVAAAIDDGHEVIGLDRKGGGVHLDVDPVDLGEAEIVIHAAAHADVKDNWANLEAIERDNIRATLRVLDAAATSLTTRAFVLISTGAVYADCDGAVTETAPTIATSPYAASKIAGEAYAQAYAARYGWRWYCLRPAAMVGPGYRHGHIADFARMALDTGRIQALSASVLKPTLHVRDLAEICVQAPKRLLSSGVYNVAAYDTLWSPALTARVMGVKASFPSNPLGFVGDSKGAAFDCSKLARCGIIPRRSIKQGVREALASVGWPC